MSYTREILDTNYGRPVNVKEVLPHTVCLSGCTNIGELEDLIYAEAMVASRFHMTFYLLEPEAPTSKVWFTEPPYQSRHYEIRFAKYQDAVRIKLMMQF